MPLSLDELSAAVAGGAVGFRAVTELEPLGGDRSKIFPPTYAVAQGATSKYAVEQRRTSAGTETTSVVLDQVPSQANRHEEALLDAVRAGELTLPLTSVDFTRFDDMVGYGRISDLQAPHRIYDAILRDSLDSGVYFRLGKVGRAITDATVKNAGALFYHSPATLVFGGWDSTGPRGGRGNKFERAFTSEIVALGVSHGVKSASRLDPLAIEKKAGPVYKTAVDRPEGWTLDAAQAVKDAKGATKALDPSEVNHGNVAPSIDSLAGGITADRIEATTVLSLVQLRRLRFPADHDGTPFPVDQLAAVETAARTALAALALSAIVLTFDAGMDLRSRCVLAAKGPLEFTLVGRAGERSTFTLNRQEALQLLADAHAAASDAGLSWRTDELLLEPAPPLVALVRKSKSITEAAGVEDGR